MIYQSLEYYTELVKGRSNAELDFALADIRETLAIWIDRPTSDPYVAKLYAERDAILTERASR